MPVIGWNVVVENGTKWLVIDLARLKIPLEFDPTSGAFLMCSMPGDAIMNYPGLIQGEDGKPPDFDQTVDFTPLAYNDPTPDYVTLVKKAVNLYQFKVGIHVGGAPGADASDLIHPEDYGTPHVGWYPAVKQVASNQYAFELVPPMAGKRYLPAEIKNALSGNAGFTLCSIPVEPQGRDHFPRLEASTVITGTGMDVRADLVGRLEVDGAANAETGGPIIARGFGLIGTNPLGIPTNAIAARKAGSAVGLGIVPKGKAAIVHVRVERQAGGETFTTQAETTIAEVVAEPLP